VTTEDVVDLVAGVLTTHRFRYSDERELQDGIEQVLGQRDRLAFYREFNLDARNRIDFYFPAHEVGLEVKIQGSAAMVLKQLERYAKFSQIDGLVLVTGRVQSGLFGAREIQGKPLRVVQLLGGLR
jgi:hypothetical protein